MSLVDLFIFFVWIQEEATNAGVYSPNLCADNSQLSDVTDED